MTVFGHFGVPPTVPPTQAKTSLAESSLSKKVLNADGTLSDQFIINKELIAMLNHLVACCLWASIEGVSKQNQYFFQWRVSAGAPPPPLSLFPLLCPAGPDFLLGPPPDLTVGQRLIPLPGCLALHQRTPQLQNCLLGSCAPFAATQLAKMMDPALLGWCLL